MCTDWLVGWCDAGEYIAAEKLEVDFASCDLVEQIWVYGNSYEVGSACCPCSPVLGHDLLALMLLAPTCPRSCCMLTRML